MSIILDSREHQLIKLLPNLPVEQLDIGDIHIRHDDKIIIIERKTIQDLRQSIGDGRYREQKQRLMSFHNSNASTSKIMYIIEGSYKFDEPNVTGAIINTIMRDNIHVVMLSNMHDTIVFIQQLCNRLVLKEAEYFSLNGGTLNHTELLIHQKKKNNITHEVGFLMQLSSIPGISNKKASMIAKELNISSMFALFKKFEENKDSVKLLSSVKGIGKPTALIILEYLGCNTKPT